MLAPAGSYEGFEAAIGAGADAVYVGGAMFGARAYAQNFTEEELLRAIDVAHIHGRKLYLTVNTLLKDRELISFQGEVQFAKSQPLSRERIRQQMDKLGNTPFVWRNLDIQMDDNIFVPMKALNEARHEAIKQLQEKLLGKYRRNHVLEQIERIAHEPAPKIGSMIPCNNVPFPKDQLIPLYVSCESEDAAEIVCKKEGVQGVYLPYALMGKYLQTGLKQGKEMYLSLPHITRGNPPEGYKEQIDPEMAG